MTWLAKEEKELLAHWMVVEEEAHERAVQPVDNIPSENFDVEEGHAGEEAGSRTVEEPRAGDVKVVVHIRRRDEEAVGKPPIHLGEEGSILGVEDEPLDWAVAVDSSFPRRDVFLRVAHSFLFQGRLESLVRFRAVLGWFCLALFHLQYLSTSLMPCLVARTFQVDSAL